MFPRALMLSLGFALLAGLSSGFADDPKPDPEPTPKKPEDPKGPKDEPKKPPVPRDPKDEPKKPKDEPKKPEEPKGPKDEPKKPKEEPKKEPEKKEPVPTAPPLTKKGGDAPPGLSKYDAVVTKEAKTQKGLFDVHIIPDKTGKGTDKVLYEIPADRLGADKLYLWRAELAKASAGGGGMGGGFNGAELGHKFIRFVRKDNRVLVYQASFDKRATDKGNSAAVDAVQVEPIIANLGVEAEGKDRSVVVTATGTIMSDSLGVGATRAAMGGSMDSDKSFLNEVKAFPTNIEARATLTFRGGGGMGGPGGFSMGSPRTSTTVVHYSLVGLPDEPMQGRLFDPRVGYFVEDFQEFGKKGWVTDSAFISRFRLEKKNKSADVSEVERPIVFYLAPEVPEKWRKWLKMGVEDWAPAFEKAGFKNAIKCEDAPKDLDPEDARYSVIRWVAEGVANAMGPHVHDPRSGETISAHIIFWHDIVKLTHMWYFIQCSAQDERARKMPFPDDLIGELIRYVAAHEVGHTLGLRHNHRASQAYSIDQLRDPKFLEKNGNVASIMSYGRYNYVAQPEDKVPAKDLIPKLAPYDFFAIEWGYKPVSGAGTPEDEKKTLDEWAAKQIKEPFLRFGGEDMAASVDPTVLTENIGNDPIEATRLGLKNIDKVLGYMTAATTAKGEEYDLLAEAYQNLLGHQTRWYAAVAKQVGGVVESRTLAGRGGVQFNRVQVDKQKAAVKFLCDTAFQTPKKLLDPELVNQFKFSGISNSIGSTQKALLGALMNRTRLARLLDGEVQDPDNAYTLGELVADVQAGVWKELGDEKVKVDPLRRGLQREFIDLLKAEFGGQQSGGGVIFSPGRGGPTIEFEPPSRSSELRAVARVALKGLHKQIEEAQGKAKDGATKAHLADCLSSIEDALESGKKK